MTCTAAATALPYQIGGQNGATELMCLDKDASNNFVVGGRTLDSNIGIWDNPIIVHLSLTGTVTWKKYLTASPTYGTVVKSVAFKSSDASKILAMIGAESSSVRF